MTFRGPYCHRYLFKYHENWGYSFRPNLTLRMISRDSRDPSFFIRTDSSGFRNDNDSPPLPLLDRKRAIFVGCSFTAGDGVENASRFTDKFAKSQCLYSAYNAGLSGAGNDQQLLITESLCSQQKADLTIISPYTGCAARNLLSARKTLDPLYGVRVDRAKPYFLLEDEKLVRCNAPVPRRTLGGDLYHFASAAQRGEGPQHLLNPNSQDASKSNLKHAHRQRLYTGEEVDGHKLLTHIILATIASAAPSRVVLMPLPAKDDIVCPGTPAYIHFFSELAARTNSLFVDVYPAFKKLCTRELDNCYLRSDIHYSQSGHDLITGILLNALKLSGDPGV